VKMIERRLIGIYLEDHWAGSTGGLELARRLRSSNREAEWAEDIAKICVELEEDRDVLREVMQALGVRRNLPKAYGAWAFEKVGRLKLNGRITGYSPLSRLLELEGLEMGITGKRSLWQVLGRAFADDERVAGFDFAALMARADEQLAGLRDRRLAAVREALVDRAASPTK